MRSVLCFTTSSGDFALPVEHVARILPFTQLDTLPGAADGVAGVVFDEGAAITVTETLGTGGSLIVVVEVGERTFGVIASDVPGVQVVDEAQIGPAPEGQRNGLVSAMIAVGRATSMLIDPEALLTGALA